MSKFIRRDKYGVIIDADILNYRLNLSPENLAKNDPLRDKGRSNIFRTLMQGPAKQLNPKMKAISEAMIEYEKVLTYNQRLLEKGLNPRDPKDILQFKVFDPSKIRTLTNLFKES